MEHPCTAQSKHDNVHRGAECDLEQIFSPAHGGFFSFSSFPVERLHVQGDQ